VVEKFSRGKVAKICIACVFTTSLDHYILKRGIRYGMLHSSLCQLTQDIGIKRNSSLFLSGMFHYQIKIVVQNIFLNKAISYNHNSGFSIPVPVLDVSQYISVGKTPKPVQCPKSFCRFLNY
jgi:hypothetical protein